MIRIRTRRSWRIRARRPTASTTKPPRRVSPRKARRPILRRVRRVPAKTRMRIRVKIRCRRTNTTRSTDLTARTRSTMSCCGYEICESCTRRCRRRDTGLATRRRKRRQEVEKSLTLYVEALQTLLKTFPRRAVSYITLHLLMKMSSLLLFITALNKKRR